MDPIDPRAFGALEAKVEHLQQTVETQGAKIDELLALANRSRGGFWAGMVFASIAGGVITFFAEIFFRR